MTKKISVDNLAKEIQKVLIEYNDELDEIVIDEADSTINAAKGELQIVSPKDRPQYANSWRVGTRQQGKRYYSKAVYNEKDYRLTHLLEFGHATKSGGRTKAKPHVRPTEQKYKQIFVDNVERKAKR